MDDGKQDSYRETLARLVIDWLLADLCNRIRQSHESGPDGALYSTEEVHDWLKGMDRQVLAQRFGQWFHEYSPEEKKS